MTIRTTPEVNAAASPPEAAEEKTDTAQEIIDSQLEQELQDGIGRRRRRVATVDKAVNISYQAEREELELRPTPTELGLEPPPERPKGLLFSSPSRRARKKRGASVKLSPLKLRDPPPEKSPEKKFGPRSKPAPLQQITKPVMDEALSRKQKERDKLSRQLQRLQADVARLEGEVARTQDPAPPDSRSQEEVDELLSILTTTNPAHKEIRPKIPQPPLSHRLSLFLPFSKQPLPPPSAAPSSTSPLPSHHPLALTDPLPHLRVFTPLTISSTDTLLPSTTPSAPLFQRHNITLASPQNLLNVNLSLTANTTTGTVDNLDVVALSPWAIPELGTWIRKRALDGDVSSIGWAIGRYWEVAQLRAKCWGRCERDHPDLVAHKGHNAGKSKGHEKPALPKRRRRSRKENQIQGDGERADGDNNDDNSVTAESLSRHHILPHLGRTSLLFQRDAISLLISWRIDFDWTGEVQSHVAASAAFPDSWERTDERHSLRKVGPLFQKLVQLKGVRGAVGVLVGLVFGG
ncbi:hypothetical protein LPUS_06991 [Lasallia pustulata]|uniref:Uncharacterized protein n=1 Tax=Lasallia pustulata TaxID=136370 RepID=A0A1W5D268_9LECA|nr:hypothetical protein LPUS_06991 [Lasallia pustulata]